MRISKQLLVMAAICSGRSIFAQMQYFLNASQYPIRISVLNNKDFYMKTLQPGEMVPADLTLQEVESKKASLTKMSDFKYKITSEYANDAIEIPLFVDTFDRKWGTVTEQSMKTRLAEGKTIILIDIKGATVVGGYALKKGDLTFSSYANLDAVKQNKNYAHLQPKKQQAE